MKAYELINLVQKDLDSYKGKKYKVTDGCLINRNGIKYYEFIINLDGAFINQNYRLYFSDQTEIEEIQQPVTWHEAEKAALDGKKIKYDNWDDYYSIFQYYKTFRQMSLDGIKNMQSGKWYIEN
ncbi:MAG: hypothetical protein ACFFDF_20955 [Candidatus Odinarchaeota archaeon]